jgi:hypothetical protein
MTSRFAFNGYNPSRIFVQPDDREDIWRFFPLERFVSLLETRRLFLCRVNGFEDKWEGAIPKLVAQAMARAEQTMSEEGRANFRAGRVKARGLVAASCWFMDLNESDAMWKLYVPTGEGVGVKTRVERLRSALPQRAKSGRSSIEDIWLGRIRYIDYDKEEFPIYNWLYPYVHKRLSFAHEKELRVATIISDEAAKAAVAGATDFEITVAGLFIAIDVATLIEEVYLAPHAPVGVAERVRAALDLAGLESVPVMPSRLLEDPIY